MKRYRINAPVTFPVGSVLGLSKEQAAARMHSVAQGPGKAFIATLPQQFKAGEVVGFEGELPKAMAADVDEEAKVLADKRAAEAATEAERKAAEEKAAAEEAARKAAGGA